MQIHVINDNLSVELEILIESEQLCPLVGFIYEIENNYIPHKLLYVAISSIYSDFLN